MSMGSGFALTAGTPATLSFSGPGFSGSLSFTYGPTADSVWPSSSSTPAYVINPQGFSGTFTDTNHGLNINNESITGLYSNTNPTGPRDTQHNTMGPANINFLDGITDPDHIFPPYVGSSLSFDNLYWPNGVSPASAYGWPFAGGKLDVYGVMFTVAAPDSQTYDVDVWFNGYGAPPGYEGYGVAVVLDPTALVAKDYVTGSVPELSTWAMMGLGFLGLASVGHRRGVRSAAAA